MTFAELKLECYRATGYTDSPPTDVATRFGGWLNEGHKRILSLPSLTEMRQGTLTFTSVASQSIYGLPSSFERLDAIVQESNGWRINMMTRDQYRSIDPGERSFGNPYRWVPVGYVPVMVQPSATGIWAVSTSGSDTTQSVKLIGIRSNGDEQAQQSTVLTGTTRVQIGTITDYQTIISWTITAAAAGTVSLYDAAAAGTELARIPIGALSIVYQAIRLWPTPTAALTYTCDGQFEIPTLVNDGDVPMLPPSYHDAISAYGRMREYERTNDSRYPIAQAAYESRVQKLRSFVDFPPDWLPVAGSTNRAPSWSNLGGWYPADGWGRP